ncbi:MAG: non-ribosomal peptide synthetase [bacterium]
MKFDIRDSFVKQAQNSPDRTALIFGETELTYRDLNKKTDQVAYELHLAGLIPGALVGLCIDKSFELVIGLISILKAGGAYVPLDPTFPEERLKYIIQDSKINFILTDRLSLGKLDTVISSQKIIYIEDLLEKQLKISNPNIKIDIDLDSTVYVMYTSGSTGNPKGVVMNNKALSNLIEWQIGKSKGVAKTTIQYSPISFDVSFQEIFSTLCCGGTLVIPKDETRRDPLRLLQTIIDRRITRIFLPFIALQQLAEVAGDSDVLNELREVITAGEQLQITPAIKTFFKNMPSCKLINQYGPTETHVVTSYELDGDVESWSTLPPIGSPIKNVFVYILDESLSLLSNNEIGELYIGGICLAKGYLNHPELTNERFIKNPFKPGLIYKTGDLARKMDSENIEFVGRVDNQVKIRGFRVEIGEIEAVLSQHPNVRECVVGVKKDFLNQNRLVAYIVTDSKNEFKFDQTTIQVEPVWHAFLSKKLPDYMIPSTFVLMSDLPLTPTGKIDRRSLPEPSTKRPKISTQFVAPKSGTEIKISGIWKEVLQIEDVGIDDNFFDLGGHSLLVTHVFKKIADSFVSNFSIIDLFQYPTIRLLAHYLDNFKKNDIIDNRIQTYKKNTNFRQKMRLKRLNSRKRDIKND